MSLETELLKQLVGEIKGLKNAINSREQKRNRVSRVTRARASGMITSEEIISDFSKLSTEVNLSAAQLRKARSYSLGLFEGFKNLITPTTNLRKIIEKSNKELNEHLRHQSETFRNVAMSTSKSFQTVIGKSADLAKSLETIAKANDAFGNTFNALSSHFEDLKKQTTAKARLDEAIAQKNKAGKAATKDGATKADKQKFAQAQLAVKNMTDSLNAAQGPVNDFKKSWMVFLSNMIRLERKGIKVFEGIDKANLRYEAFLRKQPEEQAVIIDQLKKNFKAVNMGVAGFDATLKNYKDVVVENKNKLKASLKMIAVGLITRGLPKIADDYFARQKYNVTQAAPVESTTMGLSQGELATLIGQNKTLFRVLGRGDENSPIQNGTFRELQNAAKMFGVNGKEAAELAAKFGNLNLELGYSTDSIQQQMQDFKKLSGVTGMTVDELQDFYHDLNRTGGITLLNAKYANKTENERITLVNKEIDQRLRLNKELGYNVDHLKQQNQLAVNQQNAGIESAIRRSIGERLLMQQYNKLNPNDKISESDFRMSQGATEGSIQALLGSQNPDDVAKGKRIQIVRENLAKGVNQAKNQTDLDIASNISGGSGRNNAVVDAASRILNNDILPSLSSEYSDRANEAAVAAQTAAAQSGADYQAKIKNGNPFENLFGKEFAGKMLDQIKFDEVGKASDEVTAALDLMGKKTAEVTEKIAGFRGSPLGAISDLAGYAGLFSSLTNLLVSGRLMKTMGGIGGAAEAVTAEGIGASVVSKLGAASNLLLRVSMVAVAGVVAYEIGKSVGDAIDQTSYAKNVDKMIDAKYGQDASGVGATLERLYRKFTLPGFFETKLHGLDSDKAVQDAQLKENAMNLLNNRFQGRLKNVAFGNVNLGDDKIQAAQNAGLISSDDIRKFGGSDDYLNKIRNSQVAKAVLSADDVDDGTKDKKWQEAIIQMNDRDQKSYDENKASENHARSMSEARAEALKRVSDARDMASAAKIAALQSIPRYTGT